MTGRKTVVKRWIGPAAKSDVSSCRCSARLFGASSPTTMWSAVMAEEATTNATEWETAVRVSGGRSGSRWSSGSIRRARAGSPSQPRPRLEMVIPSWVAAM